MFETVVKEGDVEVFQVGIGKMGGEGFEEIVMRWTTTKEAKVKGALFKNQRVDASRKRVKRVQRSKHSVFTSSGCLSGPNIY